MPRRKESVFEPLVDVPEVREAARALVEAVAEAARRRSVTAPQYDRTLRRTAHRRGSPQAPRGISGGPGTGARMRLADGALRLDFSGQSGLGCFGHSDADLLETAAAAAACDSVFQDHRMPGPEYLRLTDALLRHSGSRLRHVRLSVSGALANEDALKLVFQRRAPADRIVAFEGGFAGRTLALAELSDSPECRRGLPLRGNVDFIPFWEETSEDAIRTSVEALEALIARHPGRIAALVFELAQGERGFRTAPPEFFRALMQRCREAKIAVWVDERATCARTPQLFAFRTLGLDDLVDVVSVGNLIQAGAVLHTAGYRSKRLPLDGEHASATAAMAVAARCIERLEQEGYLGPEGRIRCLEGRFARRFETLRRRVPAALGQPHGLATMQACVVFDGSPELTGAVADAAFEEGMLVATSGATPARLALLPPLNVTDEELETAFTLLEKALRRVAGERDLPC